MPASINELKIKVWLDHIHDEIRAITSTTKDYSTINTQQFDLHVSILKGENSTTLAPNINDAVRDLVDKCQIKPETSEKYADLLTTIQELLDTISPHNQRIQTKSGMQNFIDSINKAINNKNPEVSLATSLLLPDMCGKIEYPELTSSKRYVKWFDKYLSNIYKADQSWQIKMYERALKMSQFPDSEKSKARVEIQRLRINPYCVFMTGSDCYALRCSLGHEGSDDISEQKVAETIGKFHFITKERNPSHNNKSGSEIQFDVYEFCREILDGVNEWLYDIQDDGVKQSKIEKLIKIIHYS